MLLEPVTPPLGAVDPTPTLRAAAARARAARAWIDMGLHIAGRPGAVDPTPGLIVAIEHATEAIREAIDACGELHEVRMDLRLALDEATGGIAALREQGAQARPHAERNARRAGDLLERAVAALVEHHAPAGGADDPVR